MNNVYDVIIIGGGPAGLNAAVVLARCHRKVLIFDHGQPRNLHAEGMHNYLTRDHIQPLKFLNLAHDEIEKYGVQFRYIKIEHATLTDKNIFEVTDRKKGKYFARKLLIATGLKDHVPGIEGFDACYGKSVHHCPYCDGWEASGKKIGVYARNKNGYELALSLKTWSDDVTLFTDGRKYLRSHHQQMLAVNNIHVNTHTIQKLVHKNGKLKEVTFHNHEPVRCESLFFVNGFQQQTELAKMLGCNISNKGVVKTTRSQGTNIKGLFVAGDAAKDMHFVVVAAAEGAKAAVHINKELQKEALEKQQSEK